MNTDPKPWFLRTISRNVYRGNLQASAVWACCYLKGPKLEIFRPVWIGVLGTRTKISKVDGLGLLFAILFFLALSLTLLKNVKHCPARLRKNGGHSAWPPALWIFPLASTKSWLCTFYPTRNSGFTQYECGRMKPLLCAKQSLQQVSSSQNLRILNKLLIMIFTNRQNLAINP
jgi:hypothetical protein